MSIEFTIAYAVVPVAARYTLYPEIGTEDPLGASQFRATWCGSPVPLKATVKVGFVVELLLTVNCPVAPPTTEGSNVSVNVTDCPGFSVAGRLTGATEKPPPVAATEFTVTAAVPLEVRVTDCVVALFTTTAPNEMLVAFRFRAGEAPFS